MERLYTRNSRGQNSQMLCLCKAALPLIKTQESVGLEEICGGYVEKVQSPHSKRRGMAAGGR
jgi:hypothetical protein